MTVEQPWKVEPNEKSFTHKGLPCAVLRMPDMEHLCGYVGVIMDELNQRDVEDMDVHGGVTFCGHLNNCGG